jgi:hypothetical protein
MSCKEIKKAMDGVLQLADFVEKTAGPLAMNNYRKMWLGILEDAKKARDPRYRRCNHCKKLSNDVEESEELCQEGMFLQILCYDCRKE